MGINPYSYLKHAQQQAREADEVEKQQFKSEEDEVTAKMKQMSTSDAMVLKFFKSMGLTDETMVMIERDLRSQKKEQK